MKKEEQSILVAIHCLVYNHEPYLRKCFDGFVMQKTKFRFVVIVHDDCSIDGSIDIIHEYEANYPDMFCPIYETENQYSKVGLGGLSSLMYDTINMVGAKYIALCEGDDYWTDPNKLQKQVDFLEAHPEYSVCWHRCSHLHADTKQIKKDDCDKILGTKEGVDISLETFFNGWYTQPLTTVFRFSAYDPQWCKQYQYFRDEHEFYHLLKQGKGYLFAFVGGVYVKHKGGIYTSLSSKAKEEMELKVARELYEINKDEYTYNYYVKVLQCLVYEDLDTFVTRWRYSLELFSVDRNFKGFVKNVLRKLYQYAR